MPLTVECVFSNNNEWTRKWDTFVGVLSDVKDKINLAAQHTLLVSNDNWQQYEVEKYQIREVTIPDWLISGLRKKYTDEYMSSVDIATDDGKTITLDDVQREIDSSSLTYSLRVVCNDIRSENKFGRALVKLVLSEDGKFVNSLREQFSQKGYLTAEQRRTVLNPPRWVKR